MPTTKYADKAFQLRGWDADYDRVMAEDTADARRQQFLLLRQEVEHEQLRQELASPEAEADIDEDLLAVFPSKPQVSPPRQNLVFTSAGDNTSFDELWCRADRAGSRSFDLWVVYYGQDPVIYSKYAEVADRIEWRKGSKFQNLYHVYQTCAAQLAQYSRIFVADDDIVMDEAAIERLFQISAEHDLWICQPAFRPESKLSHEITLRQRGTLLRYTNFVEVNTPVFSSDALVKCLEAYDERLIGWGVDYLCLWTLGKDERRRYAVIDAVPCINPEDNQKSDKTRELNKLKGVQSRAETWEQLAEARGMPESWEHETWGEVALESNRGSCL
eukprot:g1389.t1